MAQHNYRNPPVLGKDTVYETWKNEIGIWRLITDLEKKRQALAVTLSLTGQARARALELDVAQLNTDEGMDILLRELDALFLKETVDLAYEAYTNFDSFRKSPGCKMADFILEFENRYTQCKKYDMALPDPVLAFKLLDCANLSAQERKLALTASSDVKFASMKSALRRIFADHSADEATPIEIKQEAFLATSDPRRPRSVRYSAKSSVRDSSSPRGTNPLNRFGKRTKCAICQSVFHWAKDCPHRTESASVQIADEVTESHDEQCNLTLMTNNVLSENTIFMTELYGCAVIDTACSRTVCGKRWLQNYITYSLDVKDRESVVIKPSCQPFQFGDGAQVKSVQNAIIPAQIGNTRCNIDVEVVEGDLPLLLSKTSLKRAGTILDLNQDKVTMFDHSIPVQFTSSGHYCIDIQTVHPDNSDSSEVLLINDDMSSNEKRNILVKLHKQFGHASAERLQTLIRNAGVYSTDTSGILSSVVDNCDTCLKFKKQTPKPVVGFPLATEFNEVVAVDLHQLENNLWYLHIIDEFTRFSAGAIITSKQAHVFVKKFLQHWIAIHGAPKKLYSDNGGEFNNKLVHDMCENFNIEIKTTPGMSPWSNGLLERHNQTLTDILVKVKDEQSCDWDTALAWALMAKNSLSNTHGFSSYQLVYGKNPNMPSVLTDKPPALEGVTMSTVVGNNISALHSARQAFIKAESSERLRRALRKQIRPFGGIFTTGDKVYYKRPDSSQWKGPARVIGQDGVVVFARHGGMLVRVHQCRLRLATQNLDQDSRGVNDEPTSTGSVVNSKCDDGMNDEQDQCIQPIVCDRDGENETSLSSEISDCIDQPEASQNLDTRGDETSNKNRSVSRRTVSCIYKPGQLVRHKHAQSGEEILARVLCRAGKATGKNSNWYNLEYLEPTPVKGVKQSVDLSKIDGLEIVEESSDQGSVPVENDTTGNICMSEENVMVVDLDWNEAKLKELENWKQNNVVQEVPYNAQKCISTKWVCTLKDTPDGVVHKARLVARGFEEIIVGSSEIQTDSPTCSKESLRLILAIVAQNKWKPHLMDIKSAFLQSQPMERNVYVLPPKEAHVPQNKVWQLNKCVYGLNDASLSWYKKVKSVMINCGALVSKVDPAVFYWLSGNGSLNGVLASHVDDFIWSGSEEFEKNIIDKVRSQLKVGKEDSETFKYIGMEISSQGEEIHLHQINYSQSIQPLVIDKSRAKQTSLPLSVEEKDAVRCKIGQLLWLAHQSRPDISFDVSQLASSLKDGCVELIVETNKVIKRVKAKRVSLKFKPVGEEQLSFVVFSDSSLGNLADGGTQGGYFVALAGNDGLFSPLCWTSKRVRRVVRSTLAGETLAMADAIDSGIFLSTLYTELTTGRTDDNLLLPLTCVTDCKSLVDAVKSTKLVSEKRLRLEVSSIKELIDQGKVKELLWSESNKQLADCLTKRGASSHMLLQALETGILPG